MARRRGEAGRPASARPQHRPAPRRAAGSRPRWQPSPPAGGHAAITWLLPAVGNPLPQLLALAPWRRMGDEVILTGIPPEPGADWAPLVDQAVPQVPPGVGRLAWGRVVVSLPPGVHWPAELRDMILAGAEAAPWGFCNRVRSPEWLTFLMALDPRRPTERRLARRALFWRAAEAARVQAFTDLPRLGLPARIPVAVAPA